MGCGASKPSEAVQPAPTPEANNTKPAPASQPAADTGASKAAPAAPTPAAPVAGGQGVLPHPPPSGPKMKELSEQMAGDDLLVNMYYPEDIEKRTGAPLIVYQHGRGSTHHVYQAIFSRWVAMGYVVIFPYKKNSAVPGEDPPWPSTALDESPDGIEMQVALKKMISASSDTSSPFFGGRVDTKNVALGGHSMGGKSSICAGAQIEPRALLLHSPSCSSEGSEVYDLSKEQIEDRFKGLAKDKTPIMLVTSDEDVRQEAVLSIYEAEGLAACPRLYLQFSKEACELVHSTIIEHFKPPRTVFKPEFMANEGGREFMAHCYMGAGGVNDPSLKWGEVFMRLYLEKRGDKASAEYKMLFGDGPDSISKDKMISILKVSPGA
uniref:Chlorophyllase n=1 Tax=Hemiselmis andersenii TaxID=464988 RepID=A0A6T8N9F8_HEMAN|mmetsp:Transcript_8513/g.20859  ORF Transcript_8513/g.20859 Transcript_8513/m.20859 type:complete len:379 (+) Transcript_8513:208-1344(+)